MDLAFPFTIKVGQKAYVSTRWETLPSTTSVTGLRPTRAHHDEVCGDRFRSVEDDLRGAANLIDPSHVADVGRDHGFCTVQELFSRINHGVAEVIVSLQVSCLRDNRRFKHSEIDAVNESRVAWMVGMKCLRHSREGLIRPIDADGDSHPGPLLLSL